MKITYVGKVVKWLVVKGCTGVGDNKKIDTATDVLSSYIKMEHLNRCINCS